MKELRARKIRSFDGMLKDYEVAAKIGCGTRFRESEIDEWLKSREGAA